jgi:hypothetical protein
MNYFPGLAPNYNPPDLCLLSSCDFRSEQSVPSNPILDRKNMKLLPTFRPISLQDFLEQACQETNKTLLIDSCHYINITTKKEPQSNVKTG